MSRWPMIPLGEILTKSEEWESIDPERQYQEVTVRLWGKGVVQRRLALGTEFAASTRVVVHARQFVISRIDARNGASGLVPDELEGAVVSNDFPVFTPHPDRLLPEFFGWYSKTEKFVEQCRAASEGTTNRVRMKEDRFLKTLIPLPPLTEQQRLVDRIDLLAAKIDEAKKLREKANAEYDALCRSVLLHGQHEQALLTPMRDLVLLRPPDVEVRKEESYHFAGVYCFGRGVFVGQKRTGLEFAYPTLTRLRTNDFVYPKLMAWEGALAVVPLECDGLVVSTEFPVFEIDQFKVLPEVLDVYFRSPSVWPKLSGASTGTNVRRRRLNPTDFLNHRMPLPPMQTQLKLREVKKGIDEIQRTATKAKNEIHLILPTFLEKTFRCVQTISEE